MTTTASKSTVRTYQICCRCIMETSVLNIRFDKRGHCDYCNNFGATIKSNSHTGTLYSALGLSGLA